VGILNAAVWLGGGIFFSVALAPAIFSKEMEGVLGHEYYPYFSGAIAQVLIARYFHLQLVCALVALIHFMAEWLYLGKSAQALWLGLVISLFSLGIVGGFWLQPRLKELHTIRYAVNTPRETRDAATQSFRTLHGASQGINLLMLCGLAVYFWHLANPPDPTRFLSAATFRS
jgi:hypothetical protein